MPARQQPSIRNMLLAAFPAEDLALLEPHLGTVDLPRGRVLYECREIIRHAYIKALGIAVRGGQMKPRWTKLREWLASAERRMVHPVLFSRFG